MPSYTLAGATFALLSLVPSALADCESFGIDFQSGGTYFQNVNSNASFTALQQFTGCQDDTAHNVLVNPDGDQTECSETPMTPDGTPELLTCDQYPQDKLSTGDWSLLVISNNGDADPIAYQRDFSLTVGTQSTVTVTPTLTVSDAVTPVTNITSTITSTVTNEADPSTVYNGGQGTATVTPRPVTTTSIRGVWTITQRVQTWQVVPTITNVPASCSVQPTRALVKDPIATILPSVLGELDNIVEDIINLNKGIVGDVLGMIGLNKIFHVKRDLPASAKFKREISENRSPSEDLKREFVAERRNMLAARALEKRGPDERTVTFTDTANIVTKTINNNAPTTTQTITQTNLITITSTPPPVTAAPVTVTAAGITRTRIIVVPVINVTQTRTRTTTIVNTITTTSSGAALACATKGGVLVV